MNYRRFVAALFASSLGLVLACSGGTEGSGPSNAGPPIGATSQTCASFEECPSIPCTCGHGVVNARRCVDGYCLDRSTTCSSACGTDSSGPRDSGEPDPSKPAPAAGDPCVPVSVSSVVPRVGGVATRIAAHQVVPPTPANGDVQVTKDGDKITYLRYDAPGSASDYTESFTYDSGGRLTYFNHNADGSTSDYTESFTYDSGGRLTYFNHNADGSAADFTESFTYDSDGHLTYWNFNADGSAADVTESFTYDSSGLLTYFRHNAAVSDDDVTESFTYDSEGRLTYWRYDSADDATISVTYSSNGEKLTSNGTRASGAVIKSCK